MLAGVLPFAGLAVGMAVLASRGDVILVSTASVWLVIYSAVILSFLGGVRWGAEISSPARLRFGVLVVSVLGTLVGWAGVMITFRFGWQEYVLTGFAACFALHFVWDRTSDRLPQWYRKFRLWPTAGALMSLAIASVSLSQG